MPVIGSQPAQAPVPQNFMAGMDSDEYDEDTPQSEIDGDQYDTLFTRVSLAKDTRNRRVFADAGALKKRRMKRKLS